MAPCRPSHSTAARDGVRLGRHSSHLCKRCRDSRETVPHVCDQRAIAKTPTVPAGKDLKKLRHSAAERTGVVPRQTACSRPPTAAAVDDEINRRTVSQSKSRRTLKGMLTFAWSPPGRAAKTNSAIQELVSARKPHFFGSGGRRFSPNRNAATRKSGLHRDVGASRTADFTPTGPNFAAFAAVCP